MSTNLAFIGQWATSASKFQGECPKSNKDDTTGIDSANNEGGHHAGDMSIEGRAASTEVQDSVSQREKIDDSSCGRISST